LAFKTTEFPVQKVVGPAGVMFAEGVVLIATAAGEDVPGVKHPPGELTTT